MGDAVSEKAHYVVTNHGGEPTVLLLQRARCESMSGVQVSWDCRERQRTRRRAHRLVRRLIRRVFSLFLVSVRSVS